MAQELCSFAVFFPSDKPRYFFRVFFINVCQVLPSDVTIFQPRSLYFILVSSVSVHTGMAGPRMNPVNPGAQEPRFYWQVVSHPEIYFFIVYLLILMKRGVTESGYSIFFSPAPVSTRAGLLTTSPVFFKCGQRATDGTFTSQAEHPPYVCGYCLSAGLHPGSAFEPSPVPNPIPNFATSEC